ncbi:uncharacterized protein TNIN_218241 [Trichonephila inaurata madagascariensis]|uniref:Uncharacterized protein n=1 Tax=Trichonephila inaurata madagascariensis TaxID=2747483 RepID=A0A8X7BWT6_9ARAC|nr:uncharacterized protein TNIN_218241 [Trichonephila inaurata madagascariensis]
MSKSFYSFTQKKLVFDALSNSLISIPFNNSWSVHYAFLLRLMNINLERVPILSGRTERSHGHGHEMTLVEPWGRPNDRLDDPKYHPYFDESIETNVTFQVSKTAYLHCSIRQLGDRMVS